MSVKSDKWQGNTLCWLRNICMQDGMDISITVKVLLQLHTNLVLSLAVGGGWKPEKLGRKEDIIKGIISFLKTEQSKK